MKRNFFLNTRLFGSILLVSTFVLETAAQSSLAREKAMVESSGDRWWFTMIFIALCGLGGAYYFWRKSRPAIEQPQYDYKTPKKDTYDDQGERCDFDADKELAWLKKAKTSKAKGGSPAVKSQKQKRPAAIDVNGNADDLYLYTTSFQEKMRRLQYVQLPINSFCTLAPAPKYQQLPLSSDEALLSAVEQTNEEYEEDEAIRELAVRVLAAFRNSNSVDALHQVALYDLSASVRAKAVNALANFDHESVFEAILLACADPTREVRASAARGLFRLNFDRAGAWTRLIETGEEFRMCHAARAAVESGIVQKSFERLIHEDQKISYEAFCLVALLIRSGEDREIFDAIRDHKDERVSFALLHSIKVLRDKRSLDGLNKIYREGCCSAEIFDRVRKTIMTLEQVTA